MKILPSGKTSFVLKFKLQDDRVVFEYSGKLNVCEDKVFLDFDANKDEIVSFDSKKIKIETLHRNIVPLYVRKLNNEILISNDVLELICENEELKIREVELFFASINCSKDIFSHLFEDIKLLLPSSIYEISKFDQNIEIKWTDIAFSELSETSNNDFLEYLLENYRHKYCNVDEICLGLSGGYDSRLELAILSHLGKKTNCFHYVNGKREARIAKKIAGIVGARFHVLSLKSVVKEGWEYINYKGYVSRWDGYFAPGVLPTAGTLKRMEEIYPGCEKLLMATINGFKGRLYSEVPITFATTNKNKYFNRKFNTPHKKFEKLIQSERAYYIETLKKILERATQKFERSDVLTDSFYPFIYKSEGKVATRSTFLYENGMPRFDGSRAVREQFSSMRQMDKEGTGFLEFALKKINPSLANAPCVSSSMNIVERTFGSFDGMGYLNKVLAGFVGKKAAESVDWKAEPSLKMMKKENPELFGNFVQVENPKVDLIAVQIANILHKCVKEKRVRLCLS